MNANPETDSALPAGWKWARLGDVCEINPKRPSGLQREPDASTTFVPMSAVDGNANAIPQSEQKSFSKVSRGYTYFEQDDVLFAKITPCMENGKHAIAKNLIGGFGFGSTEFHVIRHGKHITPKWIHNYVRQPHLLMQATHQFRGAVGQQRLPKEFLFNLPIPLPPLDEQKRIARVLDECLALVARAKQAAELQLEAAVALPGAYLRQALPAEGDDLPAGWKWARLGDSDIFSVVSGGTPKSQIDEYWNGGIHWITLVDLPATNLITEITDTKRTISEEGLRNSAARIIPANSVTVSSRATIGRIGINRIPLATNQGFKSVVIKDASRAIPEYVAFALTQLVPIMEELASGSTYKEIIKSRFEKLLIPLPPLDEQERIASDLDARIAVAGTLVSRVRDQLDAIDALPGAYLRQAFAGEI